MTSPHQLTSSVRTLAACARTLLWSGLPGEGPGTPQQRALEFLAEAMVAMVPGLDANDGEKSRAVLDLFTVVLHSVAGPLTVLGCWWLLVSPSCVSVFTRARCRGLHAAVDATLVLLSIPAQPLDNYAINTPALHCFT